MLKLPNLQLQWFLDIFRLGCPCCRHEKMTSTVCATVTGCANFFQNVAQHVTVVRTVEKEKFPNFFRKKSFSL